MSAIIDNLWKINSELPHVSVAPETVIAPPLCLSVASAALYDDDRHAFVFVCLLSVLLCGRLAVPLLGVCAAAAISARHLNAVRGVGGGGGSGFRLQ